LLDLSAQGDQFMRGGGVEFAAALHPGDSSLQIPACLGELFQIEMSQGQQQLFHWCGVRTAPVEGAPQNETGLPRRTLPALLVQPRRTGPQQDDAVKGVVGRLWLLRQGGPDRCKDFIIRDGIWVGDELPSQGTGGPGVAWIPSQNRGESGATAFK